MNCTPELRLYTKSPSKSSSYACTDYWLFKTLEVPTLAGNGYYHPLYLVVKEPQRD